MSSRLLTGSILLAGTVIATASWRAPSSEQPSPDGLTVHEWGTFTSVAGENGVALDWYPLGGPTDLPCFVDRFQNGGGTRAAANSIPVPNLQNAAISIQGKVAGVVITPIDPETAPRSTAFATTLQQIATPMYDYEATRANVRGRVRMETPVIYFYSPTDVSASVHVDFPRGLMTEWYPSASVIQGDIGTATLADSSAVGTIAWPSILVTPTAHPALPVSGGPSHYFAARATDAATVSVNGQNERFLFYRGVANFDVPISTVRNASGSITVKNIGREPLPATILFVNQGGKMGFSVHSASLPSGGETTFDAPALTTNFAAIRVELERTLVNAGLYQREAAAMVDTWRDSWFEEGTRVMYLFSQTAIDAVLPLTIKPTPVKVARVFVGRMEIVTPALERSVAAAVAANDTVALAPTARFFGPIADRILARTTDAGIRLKYTQMANRLLTMYVRRVSTCE